MIFGCVHKFVQTSLDDVQLLELSHVLIALQHEVIPNGGLRFALTCRHIDPQTLPNDAERRIAAEKGTFPPGSEQYDYDGSIHVTAAVTQQNRGADIANDIKAKFEVGELEPSEMENLLQGLTEYITTIIKSA